MTNAEWRLSGSGREGRVKGLTRADSSAVSHSSIKPTQ